MVEQTGKAAYSNSKEYKQTMQTGRQVYSREHRGFLDRLKDATKVLVENGTKAWGDWWRGGK